MKHFPLIALPILFAAGADAGIYAYVYRERTPPHVAGCLALSVEYLRAEAHSEQHLIGASAIFANATSAIWLGAALGSYRRERERLTAD